MKFDDAIIAKVTPWRKTWPQFWTFFARDAIGVLVVTLCAYAVILSFFDWLMYMALPAIASQVFAVILQAIIRRERPIAPTKYHLFVRTYSFPSGHAFTAFALATLLVANIPTFAMAAGMVLVLSFAAFLFAFCIALARVVVGVHYPSDTLVGAVLGTIFGTLFVLVV